VQPSEFYYELRAAMEEARVMDHIKLHINEQMLPSIMRKMPQ
jgi:hypothetical protein